MHVLHLSLMAKQSRDKTVAALIKMVTIKKMLYMCSLPLCIKPNSLEFCSLIFKA